MIINKFVTDDGVNIFRLSGKLVSPTLDKLRAALDGVIGSEEDIKVAVNLRDVNIMDSVAVGLLVSRYKIARKKGGRMKFCEPQPAIIKLMGLSDPEDVPETYPTEEEAIESIREDMKTGE